MLRLDFRLVSCNQTTEKHPLCLFGVGFSAMDYTTVMDWCVLLSFKDLLNFKSSEQFFLNIADGLINGYNPACALSNDGKSAFAVSANRTVRCNI